MSLSKPYQPQPVDNLRLAFPASVADLMPDYGDIPEGFRDGRGDARRWVEFQRRWFYGGFPAGTKFTPKKGIDLSQALRHLKAIQGSFEPKHAHLARFPAYPDQEIFSRRPAASEPGTGEDPR